MNSEMVLQVGQQALVVTTLIAAPLLISALVVGLLIGMLQAATQINEMTLSFIPKLIILVLALWVAGPWMLQLIVSFTTRLINEIPALVG